MNIGAWGIFVVVLLVVLGWGVRRFEQANLYFPDPQLVADPAQVGMPFEEVSLRTVDGVTLHAWWIPQSKARASVLLLHGNAGNISHRLDKTQRLRALGVNVFLLDYRGYGQSQGRPSEQGLYRDADAAYAWLAAKQVPVFLYGESLGTAVAVHLAAQKPVAGLILESPFTSVVEMGERFYPWMPVRWIVSQRFDTLSQMSAVKAPVLVMHSAQDQIVPVELGRKVYEAASGHKQWVSLIGDHNEGYGQSEPAYSKALADFLKPLTR